MACASRRTATPLARRTASRCFRPVPGPGIPGRRQCPLQRNHRNGPSRSVCAYGGIHCGAAIWHRLFPVRFRQDRSPRRCRPICQRARGQCGGQCLRQSPNKFSPTVSFGTVGLAGDPASSQAAAIASNQVFQNGFAQGYTLAQFQAALGKVPFAVPGFYATPDNFKTTRVVEWSFEIEHPLSPHNVLAIIYSGNHGYNEPETNASVNGYIGNSRDVTRMVSRDCPRRRRTPDSQPSRRP